MKYNFNQIINRKNHDSRAYDSYVKPNNAKENFEYIPMWVSDMDFATSPSVQDQLKNRIEHPIYGYFDIPKKFYDSIIYWHKKKFDSHDIKPEYIGHETELLGGLVSSLKALNKPGDKILLHKPTYVGFINILSSLGYEIILSEIKNVDGKFIMDYDDMDSKIKKHNIKTFILCSPHNPIGRVWKKEELEKMAEIMEKNNVSIISDEIWSGITLNENKHTSIINVNEYTKQNSICLNSPNKAFNLAGFNISYHIIYNKEIRDKVQKIGNDTYYQVPNILSLYALYGAYSDDGYEWSKECNQIISENINWACNFIDENLPTIKYTKPEGTYILFIDVEDYLNKTNLSMDELINKGYEYGIGWSDGRPFNADFGIRFNLAMPISKIQEVFNRLKNYIFI